MRQKATWVFFHARTKTRRYRVFLGAVLGQHMAPSIVRPDGTVVQMSAWTLVHTSINSRHDLIRPDLVCATPLVMPSKETGRLARRYRNSTGKVEVRGKTRRKDRGGPATSLILKEILREDGQVWT